MIGISAGLISKLPVLAEKSVNSEAGIWRTLNCGVRAMEGKENRLALEVESVVWASAVTLTVFTTAANPRNGSSGAVSGSKAVPWV